MPRYRHNIRPRYLREREERMLASYNAGKSYGEIAEYERISRSRVQQILTPLITKEGGKVRRPGRFQFVEAFDEKNAKAIAKLISLGKTTVKAECERLGIAEQRFRRTMRHHGITTGFLKTYTTAEILDAIQKLAAELGRTPSALDWGKRAPAVNTVTKRFGTWSNAMRAAGLTPNPQPDMNKGASKDR